LFGVLANFCVKHGRRLAWNRNRWKDFELFKKSASRWTGWVSIIYVLITIQGLSTLGLGNISGLFFILEFSLIAYPFIRYYQEDLGKNKIEENTVRR
jgi:hypothetical protein